MLLVLVDSHYLLARARQRMASRSDTEATVGEADSNGTTILYRAYRRSRDAVRSYVAQTFDAGWDALRRQPDALFVHPSR